MSRRKRRPRSPRIIIPGEPTQAVIGVRVPPEQIEAARREGERQAEQKTDAAIDQVRADAQALETAAHILDEIPAPRSPVPDKVATVQALFALADGMRLAADRMPDSREIPF